MSQIQHLKLLDAKSMMLTQVDPSILDRILSYIPAKSLVNVALTNYQLYEPALAHLYRHLIVVQGTLSPTQGRKHHFQEFTIINGFNKDDSKKNMILILAKLTVLINSITVNPKLAQHVKLLEIFGSYNPQINDKLLQVIKLTGCKVYVEDNSLRLWIKRRYRFNSIIIDDEEDFKYASDEVDIRINKISDYDVLSKFKHLHMNPEFFKNLSQSNVVIKPVSINIPADVDYRNINFSDIKDLEIEINKTGMLGLPVEWTKLRKLVIHEINIYEHKPNELIDIELLKFFNSTKFRCLTYLAIIYTPPLDGTIVDGFEGNYLRRLSILNTLVKIVNNWTTSKINLVLPNYLQVLSCYEQPMNNLMWNGCKCEHCETYLEYLDEFIHHHKYFDETQQFWKDLNNSIVLCLVNQYFSKRYLARNNFEYLHPLQYQNWNIHVNHFSPIEFQCFDLENVNHSEYNEQGDEVFFDTEPELSQCKFNGLHKFLNVCMLHYLDDIIYPLVDLSRGNAESFELIDTFLNDGEEAINLENLSLNGFIFNFDKELNGTNFFARYYD